MPQHPAPESRSAESRDAARGQTRPRAPPPSARAWQCSCTTASAASSRSAGGPRSSTARSKVDRGVGHPPCPGVVRDEPWKVVDQHRPAGGLQYDDGPARHGVRCQAVEGAHGAGPRGAHQALREEGPPAAARVDDADARAAGAEHVERRLADARIEVARERVGHQHDIHPVAALSAARRTRAGGLPLAHRDGDPLAEWRARPPAPRGDARRGERATRRPAARGRGRRAGRARGMPRARCRWARASTLRRAMSTCAGHSDAHALHPRQSSRASWRPSSANPAAR